jgi:hypothetical protein
MYVACMGISFNSVHGWDRFELMTKHKLCSHTLIMHTSRIRTRRSSAEYLSMVFTFTSMQQGYVISSPYPGLKRSEREASQSPPSSRINLAIHPVPHISSLPRAQKLRELYIYFWKSVVIQRGYFLSYFFLHQFYFLSSAHTLSMCLSLSLFFSKKLIKVHILHLSDVTASNTKLPLAQVCENYLGVRTTNMNLPCI